MRDFFNAPNGLSKQSLPINEGAETDPSRSPFGGRTVWEPFKLFKAVVSLPFKCFLLTKVLVLQDVFDLPFHMARDQIEESLRNKMASIKVVCFLIT